MLAQRTKVASTLVLSLVALALTGCNIDPLRGERQVRGPEMNKPSPKLQQPAGGRDIAVVKPGEVDLVEDAIGKRQAYHAALSDLQNYYGEHGYATKQSWAKYELQSVRSVRQFRYLIDAEIASDALTATETIAEADALYEKGLARMRKGGHGIPGVYSRRTMLRSADIFRDLIERFPTSDKIDDAAFALGELHKEYLPDQDVLAVKWYERAWTWDPNTPHPARFQAASVYDYRLHDRDRALELYQSVLNDEADVVISNTRFATRRIKQLTSDPKKRIVIEKPSSN